MAWVLGRNLSGHAHRNRALGHGSTPPLGPSWLQLTVPTWSCQLFEGLARLTLCVLPTLHPARWSNASSGRLRFASETSARSPRQPAMDLCAPFSRCLGSDSRFLESAPRISVRRCTHLKQHLSVEVRCSTSSQRLTSVNVSGDQTLAQPSSQVRVVVHPPGYSHGNVPITVGSRR